MRVPDCHALGPSESLQLVDGLESLLPIVCIATVNQVSHLFNDIAVDGFGNRCRSLIECVLGCIEARRRAVVARGSPLYRDVVVAHHTTASWDRVSDSACADWA